MYNGIGLQTARGSGTSGYVQKNLSYNVKKLETKQQFLKRMQDARTNNLPPPRKANPQIIEHERKRQIYIQKMKLRAKLEQEKLPQEQIQHRLDKIQKILKQKLEKGEIQTKNKDTHIMTQAKQRQYVKLTEAFGIKQKQGQKRGAAFDFEGQKQQRLRHLEQKRKKMTFACTFEGCQKVYDNQHRLDRHLRHKHPELQKQIEDKQKQQKIQAQKK